ncbi:MAG: hypothetical protein LBQ36_00205 [Synergistaceae bacterium]|jgi:hypothetical protein|nr:hypothetical protein [Synergistaceae bacterium]
MRSSDSAKRFFKIAPLALLASLAFGTPEALAWPDADTPGGVIVMSSPAQGYGKHAAFAVNFAGGGQQGAAYHGPGPFPQRRPYNDYRRNPGHFRPRTGHDRFPRFGFIAPPPRHGYPRPRHGYQPPRRHYPEPRRGHRFDGRRELYRMLIRLF